MKTIRLILFMIILLSPSISFGDEATKPLIFFFSNCDNPAMDKGLKDELFHKLGIKPETMQFGENKINGYKVLLIEGDRKEANHFSAVKQLFDFIVANSIHGRLDKGKSFGELNRKLFYSQEPLILTCGIIGSYFKRMLIEEMNFESKHIRKIGMFNKSCFAIKAARKHYLKGGSNAIEIYFGQLNKWIMFDLNRGVIATLKNKPVSFFDLNRANLNHINLIPCGNDELGKGMKSQSATNKYYQEARNLYGFFNKADGQYHFLFTYPFENRKKMIGRFKENFIAAYGKNVVIYEDPNTFYSTFYK